MTHLVAGVDEAGRGPLAGPVVAAAVIFAPGHVVPGVDDSKRLTALKRDRLYDQIIASAVAYCIAEASVEEIDQLNILQATMLAMQRAVAGLKEAPSVALIDGNCLPTLTVPARAIIGGDALEHSIGAASILAKVHRDRLCERMHDQFPDYGFGTHKGYGTRDHLDALLRHGACAEHRRSFRPVREALAQPRSVAMQGRHA